ncbi:DUF3488 domain-containing protein, partial [Candidatus Peregrinibacteria bacterium]|nr:DUF3488 domain-containing protein [Candidatus Peregrinibacteria bacterium]
MNQLPEQISHYFSTRSPVSKTGVLLITLALVLIIISFTKGIQILMFIPAFILAIFLYSFIDLYFKTKNIHISHYNIGLETSLYLNIKKPYRYLFFKIIFDDGEDVYFLKPNLSFAIPKIKNKKGDYLFIIQGKLDVVRKVVVLKNISSYTFLEEKNIEEEKDFYLHIREFEKGDNIMRIDALQSSKRGGLYVREVLEENNAHSQTLKKNKEVIQVHSNSKITFRTGVRKSEYFEWFIIILAVLGVHLEWGQWGFTLFSLVSLFSLVILRYLKKGDIFKSSGKYSRIFMNIAIFLPFAYFFYECFISDDWVLAGAHFLIFSSIVKHFFQRLKRDAFTYVFLILFVFVGLSLFSLKAWFIILFFAFLISALSIFSICEGGDLKQEYSCYFGLKKNRSSVLRSMLSISLMMIFLFFLLPHGNREKQEMANYNIKESEVHTTGFDDEVTLDNIQKLKLDYSKQFVLENADKNRVNEYQNLYWRGMRFSHFKDNAWQKISKNSL